MKPETITTVRTMLASVLQDGATCQQAGRPSGLDLLNVERTGMAPVLRVAPERVIPKLGEDAPSAPSHLRQIREPVLPAAGDFESGQDRPKRSTLGPEEIADGAFRQAGSRPAHR